MKEENEWGGILSIYNLLTDLNVQVPLADVLCNYERMLKFSDKWGTDFTMGTILYNQ